MYIPNYGLRKTWLIKSLKSPFHRTLSEATCKWKQTLLKPEPHHPYHIY